MQMPVPRETVVSTRWLLERFDPEAIVEAMQVLDIHKGNVAVTAKAMPPGVGPLDQTEPVYGTKYRKDRMPAEIVAALQGDPVPELFLPGPNAFIPKDFHVDKVEVDKVSLNSSEKSSSLTPLQRATRPTLLKESPAAQLWYKKDDTFWVPKANVFIALQSYVHEPPYITG